MKTKIKIPKGWRRVRTGDVRAPDDMAWTIDFDSDTEDSDVRQFRPADSYDKDYRVGQRVTAKEFVIRRRPAPKGRKK